MGFDDTWRDIPGIVIPLEQTLALWRDFLRRNDSSWELPTSKGLDFVRRPLQLRFFDHRRQFRATAAAIWFWRKEYEQDDEGQQYVPLLADDGDSSSSGSHGSLPDLLDVSDSSLSSGSSVSSLGTLSSITTLSTSASWTSSLPESDGFGLTASSMDLVGSGVPGPSTPTELDESVSEGSSASSSSSDWPLPPVFSPGRAMRRTRGRRSALNEEYSDSSI